MIERYTIYKATFKKRNDASINSMQY